MNLPLWIFASAMVAGGLGIWLLLSQSSSRLRKLGATLAAASAVMVAVQSPWVGRLLFDSVFMLLWTVLLVSAVATIVSRSPLRCTTCFAVALLPALALLLLADVQFFLVAALAASFAILPGGFLFVWGPEVFVRSTPRPGSHSHAQDDEHAHASVGMTRTDLPAWEPLICVASGMALAGVLVMTAWGMFSERDALQQATAALVPNYLVLGALLFAVGTSGFLSRQSPIVMLLSAEVMLLGVLLSLAAHCHLPGAAVTRVPLIIVAVAAAGQPGIALVALWPTLHKQETPLKAVTSRSHLLAMAAGLLILVGALLM